MQKGYVRTKFDNVINVTEIVTVHYYEFADNFVFSGEKHDFWEMVYVDCGSVEIRRDEESVILRQGEIVFHKPNEFHSIKSHRSSPNVFVLSFVCRSYAMRFFERFSAVLDKTLKPFLESIVAEAESAYVIPKNDTGMKKLEKKPSPPMGSEQLIKTYLEQLLILLIRKMTNSRTPSVFPSKENLESHLARSVKDFLSENAGQTLRIGDICEKFGYSKAYLSRLFKQQCGCTMADYFIKKKIEYAKRLIRENKYNFTEISDRLSFDNPQYFSRVFKRVTGITPTAFRNTLFLEN